MYAYTCSCLILCGAKVIVSEQLYTKTMYSCYDSVAYIVSVKVWGQWWLSKVDYKAATPYATSIDAMQVHIYTCTESKRHLLLYSKYTSYTLTCNVYVLKTHRRPCDAVKGLS